MEKLPQIKAIFYFVGDEFNINDVTKKMNIVPTRARNKEDCPIKEFAHTVWSLKTEKETCRAVSIQVEKLIKPLIGKEEIINEICSEYNIETEIIIVISMEGENKPEMVLTKEINSFVSSINAGVGFDLYID